MRTSGRAVLRLALPLFCLAALSAEAEPPAGNSQWIVLSPEGGRFRIEIPADPQRKVGSRGTPVGAVHESRWWILQEGVELAVETHDVPRLGAAITPVSVILERSRKSVVQSKGGTETHSRSIEVQGAPAREFHYAIEASDGEPARFGMARTILVGRRLYLLTGTAAERPEAHPHVERFFGSFQFWE